MSTTVTPSKPETPVFPAIAATAMVEIPLDQIEPSPWNRKQFNQQALEELAGTIVLTDGVMEPVILRPVKNGSAKYQLVAGERRWLASKDAVKRLKFPRTTIKSIVKELSDAQAIEWTLMENGQREDVHVLELNRTYRALLGEKNDEGKPYTREMIADRVKKSYSAVCAILQTNQLIPDIQKACQDGKINSSVAMEIAKYQPKQQEQIFLACFINQYDEEEYESVKEVAKDKAAESSMSVRRLREWIGNNIHIDLTKAPFDTKDEFLVKGVPACINCPKRTGADPGLFSDAQEVKKGDTCTDPGCYEAKKEALVQLKIAEAQRQVAPPPPAAAAKPATLPPGVKPLGAGYSSSAALAAAGAGVTATPKKSEPPVQIQKISTLREDQMPKGAEKKDVLYADDYNVVKPGCKQETKAIWVDGIHIGKITAICITEGCKNHGYSSGGGGGSRDPITFERKKEIWEQKVQYVYRDELLKLIATKLPGKIGDQEAALVAEHIMKTLPHHGHEKVGRVFGLKEADPESLELHMRKLKGDALMRFIVVCALVEDLGTGEVAWGGELDKESALKIAAKAYKIDDQKLLDAAKAQLESKRPKTEKEKAAKASKQPDNKAVVERANKAKQKSKPAKKKAKGKK